MVQKYFIKGTSFAFNSIPDLPFTFNSNSQVEFAVVTANEVVETAPFKWGLWITQIKCDGTTSLESPKGCFQYFLPSSGYLTSFAFDPNGQYLKNQV